MTRTDGRGLGLRSATGSIKSACVGVGPRWEKWLKHWNTCNPYPTHRLAGRIGAGKNTCRTVQGLNTLHPGTHLDRPRH